jgi:hypothetical protein
VTARLLLAAAIFPLGGLAQVELVWASTDALIPSPYNMGAAAVCQTLPSPEIGLFNDGQNSIEVITLEPQNGAIKVSGAPLPGSSFVLGSGLLQAFYIDFTPTGTGPVTATLTVTGNDLATSTVYNLSASH